MATQPLVDAFDEQVRMVIDRFRSSGLSRAEAVGVLAILQIDLASGGRDTTTEPGATEWA